MRGATHYVLGASLALAVGAASAQQAGITRAAPTAQSQQQAAQQQAQDPQGGTRALAAPNVGAMPQPRPTPLPGQPLNLSGGGAPPVVAPTIGIRDEALNKIAPLTVEETLQIREELLRRRQAAQQPIEPVAKPVRRSIALDLSPTAAPEVIRMAMGQGTILAFYDAAGRPWPVTLGDGYSPKQLDVSMFGTNGLSMGLKSSLGGRTNVAVLLEGLDTPVVLSVLPAREDADVALEVQVPRYNPNLPAPVSAAQTMASLNAAELLDFLTGTPPKSARALNTTSAAVKAWQTSSNRMIVRTAALVAAPAWTRRQSSGTGVTVYELPLSPVVTVAVDGALSMVRVEGFAGTSAAATSNSKGPQ